jgi:hypothetical protein
MNSHKEANERFILVNALTLIAHTGCMQSKEDEALWCKKDGSAHSCYCPAGIAIKALEGIGMWAHGSNKKINSEFDV